MAATGEALAHWDRLRWARDRYSAEVAYHYDDVLREVSAAILASGSAGKADIGALLFWKRLRADTRWVGELHTMPDASVRESTGTAVRLARREDVPLSEAAGSARGALSTLPGFRSGDALASAVLTAAAPNRMAVYDRRADAGLRSLGVNLPRRGRYRAYLAVIEGLLADRPPESRDWSPRDVDLALYMLGKE